MRFRQQNGWLQYWGNTFIPGIRFLQNFFRTIIKDKAFGLKIIKLPQKSSDYFLRTGESKMQCLSTIIEKIVTKENSGKQSSNINFTLHEKETSLAKAVKKLFNNNSKNKK